MSHIALYRKYRPDSLDKLVGQSHISNTLINQIKGNKLSHAYLFSGPRGTGKTSTAKILSRLVNCENPIGENPCNQCETCKQILSDSFLDVIEMDAASHNGVDDIRSLIDGVKFPPSAGKMKVTIIDEVHMLSKGAFNALLKTLEEPPSYMMFILATTEPNKIPQTIISRCQRYDFKRIAPKEMAEYLGEVAKSENMQVSSEALEAIAMHSGGAMRDALGVLEQLLTAGSTSVGLKELSIILGSAENEIFSLVRHMANSNIKSALELSRSLYSQGRDVLIIEEDLIELLRKGLLFSAGLSAEIIGTNDEELEFLSNMGAADKRAFFLTALREVIEVKKAKSFNNAWAAFDYVIASICNVYSDKISMPIPERAPAKEERNSIHSAEFEEKKSDSREDAKTYDIEHRQKDAKSTEEESKSDETKPDDLELETELKSRANTESVDVLSRWNEVMDYLKIKNDFAHTILEQMTPKTFSDGVLSLELPKKLSAFVSGFTSGGIGDVLADAIRAVCDVDAKIEPFVAE